MASSKVLRLPIRLSPAQGQIDSSPKRFKWLKCGRRFGKTVYLAYWLAKRACLYSGKHWYVSRTLALGRDEVWPWLIKLLPPECIIKIDNRLLTITVGAADGGRAEITLKSGEKEDNLRGRGLTSLVIDEGSFLRESLFDQVLRPQLADKNAPAIIASSPKKGWFTRRWKEADTGQDPDAAAFHFTIYDNPRITREEIEKIRARTPEATWRQEYMAEEVSGVGQVYEEFSKLNIYNPSDRFQSASTFPTNCGIDYGHWDYTGAVWTGVSPEGWLIISKTHKAKNWDAPRHAGVISSISYGFNMKHGYTLDRSAFRKDPTSMTSIADIFGKEGIKCIPSEKDVIASIDIVKRFIRGSDGTPWLYVSNECQELIDGFNEWEHGEHEPDDLAGARYGIVSLVRRHLTRLADAIPAPRPEAVLEPTPAQIFAAQAKVRIPGASRWRWDFESGAPL